MGTKIWFPRHFFSENEGEEEEASSCEEQPPAGLSIQGLWGTRWFGSHPGSEICWSTSSAGFFDKKGQGVTLSIRLPFCWTREGARSTWVLRHICTKWVSTGNKIMEMGILEGFGGRRRRRGGRRRNGERILGGKERLESIRKVHFSP